MGKNIRAASDVGGTFTDLAYYEVDPKSGNCSSVMTVKVDTTPPDFEKGVMQSIKKSTFSAADLDFFAHGSTLVINALTERKGVKTALITTQGFRDVLEIARGNRPDLFNFSFTKPKPFVPRYLRRELPERVSYKGALEKAVDLSALPEMLAAFQEDGVQAIAVVFLHAYIHAENEQAAVSEIKRLWPEVSVLASHEISREWREYERTSTTVLSAYVHPIAKRYIENLEEELVTNGFRAKLYMMQSNGGISTVEAAKANPITMVESGPASGIYAAAYLGSKIGEPNLIALDIGGTTAKCTLIENGEFKVTTEYHIEQNSKNPGYPIQTPVSEIVEIGNGGGSIAWIDEGGKLHVGPQSAGAQPGPAAYGRGGLNPTTTDANLVLGRIDPTSFVGGEVTPDWDAINTAMQPLAETLSIGRNEVARGIVRIANANMVNALRLVSTNKGYDPRDFALIAFGGGGAMHAIALAEELKVPRVIVPANSSVFSAWGMLLTDLRRDYLQTLPLNLNTGAKRAITMQFDNMVKTAKSDYNQDEIELEDGELQCDFLLDLRYAGQEHTIKVPLVVDHSAEPDIKASLEAFHIAHEKRFTYRLENDVQIVNFHLVAKVEVYKPDLAEREILGRKPEDTLMAYREVDFDQHGRHKTPIHNGLEMEMGMSFTGPLIVQEPSVTLVVPPGHEVSIDRYGNYHITLNYDAEQ